MKGMRFSLVVLQYAMLFAVAVVVAMFFQYRTIDIDQHNARFDLMLQLEKLEADLDRDVLQVSTYLLDQFDVFVGHVHSFDGLAQRLREVDAGLPETDREQFRYAADLYLQSMETKLELLEGIKSKAALVGNGLRYLPVVVAQLAAESPGLALQASEVLNELYRYNTFPSGYDRQALAGKILTLNGGDGAAPLEEKLLANIRKHMQTILTLSDDLTEIRDRYVHVPSSVRFKDLYDSYNAIHASQTRRLQGYSVILLAIAIMLFFSLGMALRNLYSARIRAERAWAQLHDAVESLSEGFALFAADGRLILHNEKYRAMYPWLSDLFKSEAVFYAEIVEKNAEHVKHAPLGREESGELVFEPVLAGKKQSYLEHFFHADLAEQVSRAGQSNEYWYLASDSVTRAQERVCVRVDVTESKRAEMELRKLHRALEQSPVSVLITDMDGTIEYVNPAFEQVSGYRSGEVMGLNPRILKSGDKTPEDYAKLWQAIKSGMVWHGEFYNRKKDGSNYWEAASISPVRDDSGVVTHFIAVKEDITEKKKVEEELRLNAAVFEATTEGIIVTDADNRVVTVNPAFTRITGFSPEEVLGRIPAMFHSESLDSACYEELLDCVRRKGAWTGELRDRRKDGSEYPLWLSFSTVRGKGGEIEEYVAVFSDITQRKRDEELIRKQANYDALTGLPNRTLFMDLLDHALATARREDWLVALLFIDLDRFKEVNDALGHGVGDELLQKVAARIGASVRESDMVARFGGDEFVVILEDLKKDDDAAAIARKIIQGVAAPFILAQREFFIGASIGVTLYPLDSQDPETMLRNADMAMYRAKDLGRNTYQFFTRGMNESIQERVELERELHLALEREEFVLRYQPIVDLSSGAMVGVESLVRWLHPEWGEVPPGRFVPIAEEMGLIKGLGDWVLHEACRQGQVWCARGLDLKISVNVSSRQIALGMKAREVRKALDHSGLAPHLLTLEITEGVLLDCSEATVQWLQEVKALGVSLSIDDFGTGYSSLSYLKRFPMDYLKIDQSFVRDLPDDVGDASLVRAMVAMAQSLHLGIVAEGVETQEQFAFLRGLRCEHAQGYWFSKPLWAEEIPGMAHALLHDGRARGL